MSSTEQVPGLGNDGANQQPEQKQDDAVLMSPDEVAEMLKISPKHKKRRLVGLAAAVTAVTATAALLVADPFSAKETDNGLVAEESKDSGNAARQPHAIPLSSEARTPEQGPLRGSLCNKISLEQLLRWTGEKAPEGHVPAQAQCTSAQTGLEGMPLRAHARWSWAHLPRSGLLDHMEVAVYDERQPDGSSAFSRLMTTYAPARSRPMQAGDQPLMVASANSSTVVNVPESGIDLTFTTRLAKTFDSPATYPKLQEAQVASLPQLVPVIVNG